MTQSGDLEDPAMARREMDRVIREDYASELRQMRADIHSLREIVSVIQANVNAFVMNPALLFIQQNPEQVLVNLRKIDSILDVLSGIQTLLKVLVWLVGSIGTVMGVLLAARELFGLTLGG